MSLKIDFAKEIAKLIKRTRKMLEKRDSEINRYELTKTANIEVPSSNSELDILSDEQIVAHFRVSISNNKDSLNIFRIYQVLVLKRKFVSY